MSEIIKVPIEKFNPNPYQPKSRVEVTPETAEYYGKSILEHGLLQIPLARQAPYGKQDDWYEMGDGWLRLQGHKWLVEKGHPEFNEIPVDIRALSDEQMAHMVFEANGVRKNLEPIEKANFFQTYMKYFKVSEKQMAKKFGVSQGEISNTLRLLQLPAEIQTEVTAGKVSQTHARELVRLKNKPEKQKEITQEVIKGGVSVKELSKKIDAEVGIRPENRVYEDNTGIVRDGNGDVVKEGVPCENCGSAKECHREFFYAAKEGNGYLCDRKTPTQTGEKPITEQPPASTTNPVLTASLCDQETLERYAAINSCNELTFKPPKFRGLFGLEDKIYACVSSLATGLKTEEVECYQVMEFRGTIRWGSYKGKNYVLVGSPVNFIAKTEQKKRVDSKPSKKK